jgi:hypothetical protein
LSNRSETGRQKRQKRITKKTKEKETSGKNHWLKQLMPKATKRDQNFSIRKPK